VAYPVAELPVIADDDRARALRVGARTKHSHQRGVGIQVTGVAKLEASGHASAGGLAGIRVTVEHHRDRDAAWAPRAQTRQQPAQSGLVAHAPHPMEQVVAVDEDQLEVQRWTLRSPAHGSFAADTINPCSCWSISTASSTAAVHPCPASRTCCDIAWQLAIASSM